METPEKKIEWLEAALKIAKFKIWVASIIGIIGGISLFGVGVLIGNYFDGGSNEPVIPDNTLTIPLGTPPDGFGRQITSTEIDAVKDGFDEYQTMLDSGFVTIRNGTQPPEIIQMNSLFSKFEYISVGALAQMLKKGQIEGTTGTIQPAFIRIQDCRMLDPSGTPVIKKYMMMVDGSNNVIQEGQYEIFYNDLRRCPPDCQGQDD